MTEYLNSADINSEPGEDIDVKPFNLLASNRLYRVGPALDAFAASCIILIEDRLSQYLGMDVSAEHTLHINEKEVISSLDPHETTRLGFSSGGMQRLLGTISMDNTLARGLLDIACGGEGEMYPDAGPLTVGEHSMGVRLGRWFIDSFNSNFNRASESSKQLVNLDLSFYDRGQSATLKLADNIERATIDMRITTGNVDGVMTITMPADFIFRCMHIRGTSHNQPVSREHLQAALLHAPILVNATLNRREVTIRDVMQLTPGTLIPLSQPDVANIHTQNYRLFQGQVIHHDDHRAIQIIPDESTTS